MRITYDPDVDAAYLYLVDPIADGQSSQTIAFIDAPNGQSQIALDFDENGFLLGVEILWASQTVMPEILAGAELP